VDPSKDCFLCEPDPALVYAADERCMALSGLGPIVNGYSVVATRRHIRSCADAAARDDGIIQFAGMVRSILDQKYGSCLLTEHGRMEVCKSSVATDVHCYHAHFLLFPGAPALEEKARAYFAQVSTFATLSEALFCAKSHGEYFLFSPEPRRSLVMTRPGRLIRQFARLLVAEAVGQPHMANWSRFPNTEQAQAGAISLRPSVPLEKRALWAEQK